MDTLDDFLMTRAASPDRPLAGLTILLVEDSRFAADGLRLIAQRSGARFRRADSLQSARRHLAVYRPTVVAVDLGLPDGSGLDLIRDLACATPRVTALIALSGDTDLHKAAISAGADTFIAKPIDHIAQFQQAILARLPSDRIRPILVEEEVPAFEADPLAYNDDLAAMAEELARGRVDYVIQFLSGVTKLIGDEDIAQTVRDLAAARRSGALTSTIEARLGALLDGRAGARMV
jgi:DNA-binding response OmpR family regulator